MIVASRSLVVATPARQEFFDVTDEVTAFIAESGLADGVVVASTQHTSCCVIIQEESEDVTYYGTQLILQDTLNVLAKIAPPTRNEGQYLHPGPIHIEFEAAEDLTTGRHPSWGLNTDGHIISSILGRSVTVPVQAGQAVLGEFGRIYLGDLDAVRDRERTVVFTVMGR